MKGRSRNHEGTFFEALVLANIVWVSIANESQDQYCIKDSE
jgi:hypothetical protein